MAIDTLVLGAGQEVGKSCVVVTINGKRIMFDCGMHMSYNDHRQYPDFSLIGPNFDQSISCVIITHCHLDHVGALPYFTEVCGYSGPIYMTHPTKALSPIMLEDYRKMVDRRGGEEQFTLEHIEQCMKKVTTVDVKQTVQVDKDLQIRPYYAGHVLGAAMFYAKVGDAAMVYTGDYNMTSDRHLGAAQIERLNLDLVITESTYATTIRDSRFAREREFLEAVSTCVTGGGKVLIPAFALGRTQELCILLEDYWERMNLKVPIYISSGLTLEANLYYKLYISWTSQKIKETYSTRNAFDFKHVHEFERSMIDAPGPCVLFATPGMLGGGFSVEVFKHWAPSDKNLVIMSGYCLPGTLGHKLTSGKDTQLDVRCKIHQLAFSPHTDAKGIMDLLKFLSPKYTILVHGEKPKMAKLKGRIESELGIPCHCPANNECVSVPSTDYATAVASDAFIRSCSNPNFKFSISSSEDVHGSNSRNINSLPRLRVSDDRVAEGILIVDKNKKAKVVHQDELPLMLGKQKHLVKFAYCCPVDITNLQENEETKRTCQSMSKNELLRLLSGKLSTEFSEVNIQDFGDHLQVGTSLHVSICLKENCPYRLGNDVEEKSDAVYFCCSWGTEDENLPWKIISMLQKRNIQDVKKNRWFPVLRRCAQQSGVFIR